jgi:hypothetical protein
MKKRLFLAVALVLVVGAVPAAADGPTTKTYGDVTLTGGFPTGHFMDWWDLTEDDITISFTYDATGLVDDSGAHAWAEFGVRSACYGDFNPTWMAEGSGVWLATDYDWNANTFDPDPVGSPTLDMDDKLILQKGGGMGEGAYNLPSVPPNPWANHAVWFDRDGVDPWQAGMWGAIDGVTYNTGGTYEVVLTLQHTGGSTGEAYLTINGEAQGFYDPNWHPGPADLMPAGMSFTGDVQHLRVFYGLYGYGASHTVAFEGITVEGVATGPPMAPCFERAIDVKPCSDPNSINLKSKGVVPVAVLGDGFDVSTVDPATVMFAGAAPLRWHVEDVCPYDGVPDLVFHFKTPELDLDENSETAELTGYLMSGEFFWGTDAVRIMPRGK